MSTSGGGPGWWQGPDGRWYPPRPPDLRQRPGPSTAGPQRASPRPDRTPGSPHHGPQAPFPAPSPPPYAHDPYRHNPYRHNPYRHNPYGHNRYGHPPLGYRGPPPPYPPPLPPPLPPRRRIAVIAVVVGSAIAVVVLAGLALAWVISTVADSMGGSPRAGCTAVSTAEIDATLGGSYEVVQLGGTTGGLTAPVVLDSRVLGDAALTCWAVESGPAETGGRLARIARHEGTDAQRRFAAERATAMGTTEDRGGGLSVSTAEYFNKDVPAGDEAFCTSGDFLGSAGALVRRGGVLVYVSTTAARPGASSGPDIDVPTDATPNAAITFGTDDANCELAVALAAKVS